MTMVMWAMLNGLLFDSGDLRITETGPRMFWKRHRMKDMPIGLGGCFVPEPLPDGVSHLPN